MNPVALVLRHGTTELNEAGAFRGWVDIPLNKNGIQQAKKAAEYLKNYKISSIVCSPLLRAFVTADIVAATQNLRITQTRGLFPLNVGCFSGLNKDLYNDSFRLFVKNPTVQLPEGESIDAFEERQFTFWKASLTNARTDGLTLFVCHTSNFVALQNFTEGMEEVEPELGETVSPGGISEVYWQNNKYIVKPVVGKTEEAEFGSS